MGVLGFDGIRHTRDLFFYDDIEMAGRKPACQVTPLKQ